MQPLGLEILLTWTEKVINPYVGNTGAIINHAAARDLNASIGDKLTIIAGPNSMAFSIKGIDYSFERSGFPWESDHAVVSLSAAQSLVREQGKINFIAITNSGGIRQSIEYTHQVGKAANSTLSTFTVGGNQLYAFGDKKKCKRSSVRK
jgi:hypothetical protein